MVDPNYRGLWRTYNVEFAGVPILITVAGEPSPEGDVARVSARCLRCHQVCDWPSGAHAVDVLIAIHHHTDVHTHNIPHVDGWRDPPRRPLTRGPEHDDG